MNHISIEEFINTTGTVYPVKEVSLSSEMSGLYRLQTNPITGRPYALGDKVSQGATIIKLEDQEYVNNLRIKSKEVDLEIKNPVEGNWTVNIISINTSNTNYSVMTILETNLTVLSKLDKFNIVIEVS